MDLVADYTGVVDQAFVYVGGAVSEPARCIAEESMVIGMPELTEDNIDEFYCRSVAMSLVRGHGPYPNKDSKNKNPRATWIHYSHLRRMIGLTTKALSSDLEQFKTACQETLIMNAARLLEKAKEPPKFKVTIRLTRMEIARLMHNDDRKFFGEKNPGRFKLFNFDIQNTECLSQDDARAEALRRFNAHGYDAIVNKNHFRVEVTKVIQMED